MKKCFKTFVGAAWGIVRMTQPACSQDSRANSELEPLAFEPLPLGSISPEGWLKDQMQLMAEGLAGHEFDIYRYVSNSPWMGGNQEYSDIHEAFPYWMNGIVPLAYGLNDERLKTQVKTAVEYVLAHQAEDGWIGTESKESGLRNFWGRTPLLLAFINLLDADESYHDSVLPAIRRYTALMNKMLSNDGEGFLQHPMNKLSEENLSWGRVRVADMMLTLQWLLENDAEGNQREIILDNLDMLNRGAIDWADWYQEGVYIKEDLSRVPEERLKDIFPYLHGVNVAQGLKTGAVINRFTRNSTQPTISRRAVSWTFQYHGSTSGSILADERLKGLGPYWGSELCTTVEAIFSLSYLYQALGDVEFADRAERAAFNALPAAVTPDWWAHQYVTVPNAPVATKRQKNPFWNVRPLGATFGLEPNYPCCTVNHHQGYPKFLAASWVRYGDDGLGHALLGPSKVTAVLRNGATVEITCNTKYPFSDTLTYMVKTSAPFKFLIRKPSWSTNATARGHMVQPASQGPEEPLISHYRDDTLASRTGMTILSIPAGISQIIVTLTRHIETVPRSNDSVAIYHGPLLYTLDVGEETVHSGPPRHWNTEEPLTDISYPSGAKDYEFCNMTAWNMGIEVDSLVLHEDTEKELANPIWARGAPPVWMEGLGREIEWPVWKGGPGPVPARKDRKLVGTRKKIKLIPFGSAVVGMAELPAL